MRAEQYNMTVAKLLTGRDMPYNSLEMALQNTYALAKNKLDKQNNRGKRGRRR